MTDSSTKPSSDHVECPLGDLAEALREARCFYVRHEDNVPFYRDATAWDSPDLAAARQVIQTAGSDKAVDEFSVNGVGWQQATMPEHQWTEIIVPRDVHGGARSHHHTTFEFGVNLIHVDFITRTASGPGSGVRDTQFFVDGKFVSRGGHGFTVPMVSSRGEPAALRWDNHLFICKRTISHLHVPHPSWFTLWKRVQPGDPEQLTQ